MKVNRSAVIAVAIDARRQYYPHERSFVYQPFAGREHEFRFYAATYEKVIRNDNLNDLAIRATREGSRFSRS